MLPDVFEGENAHLRDREGNVLAKVKWYRVSTTGRRRGRCELDADEELPADDDEERKMVLDLEDGREVDIVRSQIPDLGVLRESSDDDPRFVYDFTLSGDIREP